MKDIRPIRTEDDLSWTLNEIEQYFVSPPEPGTEEANRFDVLSDLIEAYENRHHPISAPDPIQALTYFMEENNISTAELAAVLGSSPRASEIISKKRRLSLEMIRKINAAWKISAETLIQPYHLEQ